jgi:23S rRNA (adenine2030-N6)-methyltransferase
VEKSFPEEYRNVWLDQRQSTWLMNYRHAFHAGNFADVFKHLFLTRIFTYLARKDATYRYIDTHAGHGSYDLSGEAAGRTAEWRSGIGRLLELPPPPELEPLLAPYLAIVQPSLAASPPLYRGSPALAVRLMRRQDKLMLCDAYPPAAQDLAAEFGSDARVKVIEIDGYTGLNAFVPPVERRGLVLMDPPFEAEGEFGRLGDAIVKAVRKWPTGIYMMWFPIKDRRKSSAFLQRIVDADIRRVLYLELRLDVPQPDEPMAANGLVIVNPPYVLEAEARLLLPYLAAAMGAPDRAGFEVTWASGE